MQITSHPLPPRPAAHADTGLARPDIVLLPADQRTVANVLARTFHEMSLLDGFVLAYLSILVLAAVLGHGPARTTCLLETTALWSFLAAALVIFRGGLFRPTGAIALVHRVTLYATFQASYFFLRDLLPLASPHSLDAQLHRLDVAIFGVEPTLWVDRFVTPATTEWFSFFYWSYFLLLAVHVLPFLVAGKARGLFPEFVTALLGVYGIAQLVYFLVPGFGPYHALAGQYAHEQLPAGTFHDLVMRTVALGGAQKDIFPSLHTAAPFTIALFSFLHRDQKPFRYTWPVMAFFSLQIIGATIFLRWHWAIDVLAGLALAVTVTLAAGPITRWERARREARGLGPAWGDVLGTTRPATAPAFATQPLVAQSTEVREEEAALLSPRGFLRAAALGQRQLTSKGPDASFNISSIWRTSIAASSSGFVSRNASRYRAASVRAPSAAYDSPMVYSASGSAGA
jgi:hypothetical protein